MTDAKSWEEYGRHVLAELERINAKVDEMQGEIHKARIEIATLQVKASMWGGLAGLIAAAVVIAIGFISRAQ